MQEALIQCACGVLWKFCAIILLRFLEINTIIPAKSRRILAQNFFTTCSCRLNQSFLKKSWNTQSIPAIFCLVGGNFSSQVCILRLLVQLLRTFTYSVRSVSRWIVYHIHPDFAIGKAQFLSLNILQFPALTLCNSANGGKALIFRRFRHLPFGRVIRISRRIPAWLCAET